MTNLDCQTAPRRWSRLRIGAWALAALLVAFPALAVLFTNEMRWSPGDFILAACLVFSVGLCIELALSRTRDPRFLAAKGLALAALFLLVWIEAAVGIVGAGNDETRLLFVAVVMVWIFGSLWARFRAREMAKVMFATATAQATAAIIIFATGMGTPGSKWPWDFLVLTGFFTALFTASGVLFRKAALGLRKTAS